MATEDQSEAGCETSSSMGDNGVESFQLMNQIPCVNDFAPKDQSEAGCETSSRMGDNGVESFQLKNQIPCVNDFAPKARKPYTISKKREKWSEEEHKKFIEALKLYGRAWRHIEEHVGTKNAVQIRSHAQKFFCKVVRESNTNDTSPVKPIEIPPPRPKRKPLHPYPRKMVVSSKTRILVGEKLRRSMSPNLSASEQDNQSPTSVLCALETFDVTHLDTQNTSVLPVTSPNGSNTSCLSVSELNSSPVENEFTLSKELSDSSGPDEQVPMKLDLFPQESIFGRERQAEAAPIQSLKLFGKTVLVSDSQRLFSQTEVTCEMDDVIPLCSFGSNSMPREFSSQPSLFSHVNAKYPLHIPVPTKAHSLFIGSEKGVSSKDDSWSIANYGLVNMNSEPDTQSFQFPSNNEESKLQLKLLDMPSDRMLSSGQRDGPERSPRGFVPYKRCSAPRDTIIYDI